MVFLIQDTFHHFTTHYYIRKALNLPHEIHNRRICRRPIPMFQISNAPIVSIRQLYRSNGRWYRMYTMYGRHGRIWTADIYRVKVALSPWATCLLQWNNYNSSEIFLSRIFPGRRSWRYFLYIQEGRNGSRCKKIWQTGSKLVNKSKNTWGYRNGG